MEKRQEVKDDDMCIDSVSKTEHISYFQDVEIKLADFGMAGFISPETDSLRGRCGTPGYVAPEILKAQIRDSYPSNVDMFSIGVVAYTLLCGYEPFYGQNDRDLIHSNRKANYEFHLPEWKDVSNEAKDLVSKMMQVNPFERIYPEQALRHPWLSEFCSNGKEASDEKKDSGRNSVPDKDELRGDGNRYTDCETLQASTLLDVDDDPFISRNQNPCVIM